MPDARPSPQPSEPTSRGPRGCFSVVLASGLALFVFAVLFMLSGGAVAPAVVAAGAIFGVAALHYVIWGWWLSGIIRQQVEDEEQRSR